MTHRITRESARAAKACWTDEEIADVIPPEGLTPRELVAQIGIERDTPLTLDDCLWALCYACGVSDRTLRLFAVWCARRDLARVESPDTRNVAAADTAERYATGDATADELSAAWKAAWAASWSVALNAARAVALNAAWAAACDAAMDEELAEELNRLVEMIEAE